MQAAHEPGGKQTGHRGQQAAGAVWEQQDHQRQTRALQGRLPGQAGGHLQSVLQPQQTQEQTNQRHLTNNITIDNKY